MPPSSWGGIKKKYLCQPKSTNEGSKERQDNPLLFRLGGTSHTILQKKTKRNNKKRYPKFGMNRMYVYCVPFQPNEDSTANSYANLCTTVMTWN